MALLQSWLDEQDKQRQGNFKVSKGGSSILGGAAGSQAGSTEADKTKALTGTDKGSGFTNLNTYLDTNKTGAEDMSKRIQGADIAEGTKYATDLGTKQATDIQAEKDKNKAKSFDLNLLNDPTKLTDAQKAEFSAAYGQSYDPNAWKANENFTVEGQKTALDQYDARAKGYGEQSGREARMGALTRGQDAIFKSGRGGNYTQGLGRLDAFLLGGQQEGLKKGSEEAKSKVSGQISSGEAQRLAAGKDIQSAIDAARSNTQTGYNTYLTGAESSIPTKMSDVNYEKYTGPAEFVSEVSMSGLVPKFTPSDAYLKALNQVKDINTRNAAKYAKTKADFETGGKAALAKRNALAALTGQAAKNVDFSKLVAAVPQVIADPTNTYKTVSSNNSSDNSINPFSVEDTLWKPISESTRQGGDYVKDTLETQGSGVLNDLEDTWEGRPLDTVENNANTVKYQVKNAEKAIKNVGNSIPKIKKPSWM